MHTSNRSGFRHWPRKASVTTRTAVYGPVRTVVWQGSAGNRCPYADQCPLSYIEIPVGEARQVHPIDLESLIRTWVAFALPYLVDSLKIIGPPATGAGRANCPKCSSGCAS